MAINYERLSSLSARTLVGALERDGFELERTSPPHYLFRHADGRRVTVSYYDRGDTFPPKALKRMIEVQAGWNEDDLVRLLGTVGAR